jgi:hypothetical protein
MQQGDRVAGLGNRPIQIPARCQPIDAPAADSLLDNCGQRIDRSRRFHLHPVNSVDWRRHGAASWRMPALAPPSYPIDTAPKVPEVLLLWRHDGEGWVIGFWDGDDWFAETGPQLDPIA